MYHCERFTKQEKTSQNVRTIDGRDKLFRYDRFGTVSVRTLVAPRRHYVAGFRRESRDVQNPRCYVPTWFRYDIVQPTIGHLLLVGRSQRLYRIPNPIDRALWH